MTPFARRVLGDLPPTTSAGTANNYRTLQLFTNDTDKYNGKVDVDRLTDALAVRPLRLPGRGHLRQSTHPAALGRQRQRRDLRHQQAVRHRARPGPGRRTRCSKRGSATPTPSRARTRRRSVPTSAQEVYGISGLPERSARRRRPARRRLITGYSDLGRQATNPQWQYPRVFNPEGELLLGPGTATRSRAATSSSTSRPRCRTSTRSMVATPTAASSRARPASPPPTSTTSPISRSASGRSTRSATSWSRTCGRTCTSSTRRTTGALTDTLTLNLGLRYEYATPWVEKDNILSNWDPDDAAAWLLATRRVARRPLDARSRPQQLGPAARVRMVDRSEDGGARRLRPGVRATSTAPAAPTCCRSTARR